ncbi:MAG: hypothetical protein ACOC33_03835 [bacterium]
MFKKKKKPLYSELMKMFHKHKIISLSPMDERISSIENVEEELKQIQFLGFITETRLLNGKIFAEMTEYGKKQYKLFY